MVQTITAVQVPSDNPFDGTALSVPLGSFNIQNSTFNISARVLPLSDLKPLLVSPSLIDPDTMVAVVGDLQNLPTHRIAILNSRQRRLPEAQDLWLSATSSAIERAISGNSTVVSSLGMITWEWVVWNTRRLGGSQIIIVPRGKVSDLQDRVRHIIVDFDLDPSISTFLMPFNPKKKPFRKSIFPERDRWAVALSHTITPISIRPSGIMARLLAEGGICARFDTSSQVSPRERSRRTDPLRSILAKSDSTSAITGSGDAEDWAYLTHWTRACHGPWMGECSADFYSDLYHAESGYPRDGFNTLKRILTERKIRASGRMMPGGTPMISWTATTPSEILKIIRWRPGFIRWNFEPFGISIRKKTLESFGAQKVTYGAGVQHVEPLHFFRPITPEKDWSTEVEWRLPGDLDLGKIRDQDAIIWVQSRSQVSEMQKLSPFPVRSLLA